MRIVRSSSMFGEYVRDRSTATMDDLLEVANLGDCLVMLNTTKREFDELLERLQDWIALQPHLPSAHITKQLLENTLLRCKMSFERSKQNLDMHFTLKSMMPEIFQHRDPSSPNMQHAYECARMACLPTLTPDCSRVTITCFKNESNRRVIASDLLKYMCFVSDIRLQADMCLTDTFIYDLGQLEFQTLAHLTPDIIRKIEILCRKIYPGRVRQIHIINAPPYASGVISLLKKTVKSKLAALIHIHKMKDIASLHEFIPRKILPKDYGGDAPSIEELADLWRKRIYEWKDWFIEDENISVDEKVRPGPTINYDDLFGYSGTFRKLDVD